MSDQHVDSHDAAIAVKQMCGKQCAVNVDECRKATTAITGDVPHNHIVQLWLWQAVVTLIASRCRRLEYRETEVAHLGLCHFIFEGKVDSFVVEAVGKHRRLLSAVDAVAASAARIFVLQYVSLSFILGEPGIELLVGVAETHVIVHDKRGVVKCGV